MNSEQLDVALKQLAQQSIPSLSHSVESAVWRKIEASRQPSASIWDWLANLLPAPQVAVAGLVAVLLLAGVVSHMEAPLSESLLTSNALQLDVFSSRASELPATVLLSGL